MRKALALAVRFAAQAVAEALARRRGGVIEDQAYSPAAEIARIVGELSALETARAGLEPGGEAARARAALDHCLAEAPDEPLSRIERGLGLDAAERDVLRVLLAWSLEPRVGLLVGHIHDELQRTRPTLAALAEILNDPLAVTIALDGARPLRRQLVVELDRAGPDGALSADPRLVTYAASGRMPPLTAASGACALASTRTGDLPRAAVERAALLEPHAAVVARGPSGSGRRSLGLALAAREGRPALVVEPRAREAGSLVPLALRDARVLGARLIVSGPLDDLGAAELAGAIDVPIAVGLDEGAAIPEPLLARPLVPVDLGVPSAVERAAIWRAALGDAAPEAQLCAAAERYAFTPGRILRAAVQARSSGVEAACRLQLRHALDGIATRHPDAKIGWDRLVLPPTSLEALRAVAVQVAQRVEVGERWGFARHHALGHGVKALFFGKPGTGKTMAAEILAGELSMPLYRVDLSRVVSKWIGETEQNLARVFDEARLAHAMLFFDEADSLFSRRTSVQSSTDRYANMEVNYLLQRIEEHAGVILLATNLKANMDEAFARRLHHVIDFPEPDAPARERIWRLSVPPDAPLHDDVDFQMLARRFELPGGAIRNAVLGAAYLAAASSSPIRLRHVAAAIRGEYAKLDRLYPRADIDALMAAPS